jgi:hypothetical protein
LYKLCLTQLSIAPHAHTDEVELGCARQLSIAQRHPGIRRS